MLRSCTFKTATWCIIIIIMKRYIPYPYLSAAPRRLSVISAMTISARIISLTSLSLVRDIAWVVSGYFPSISIRILWLHVPSVRIDYIYIYRFLFKFYNKIINNVYNQILRSWDFSCYRLLGSRESGRRY